MDRTEAAIRLHVAEQDVQRLEPCPEGIVVTLQSGERRLLTEHGWKDYEPSQMIPDVEVPSPDLEPEPVRDTAVTVPEGSVREILEWVGDDRERATEALRAERARDTPRKSLLRELESR